MEQQPPEQIRSELETFRQQWREEVSARSGRNPRSAPQQPQRSAEQSGTSSTSHQRHNRRHEPPPPANKGATATSSKKPQQQLDYDEDIVSAPTFGYQDAEGPDKSTVGQTVMEEEPKTALDYYEHAVEREATGKLGDSLQLYRTAFRMDDNVDKKYREKHYADRWAKPAQKGQQQQQQQINPSNAPVTVPNTAHHSLHGSTSGNAGDAAAEPTEAKPLSLPELIASFANLKVAPAGPECEGMEAPPCPIAALPEEILLHILRDVAISDVGDFVRLARVCRRLAFLVATEEQIWRRVCLGSEFGFGGMHYHWQRSIAWEELGLAEMLADSKDEDLVQGESDVYTAEELHVRRAELSRTTTLALYRRDARQTPAAAIPAGVYGSWKTMFRQRPRVRFNGCYISTVNYIRPGQNTGNLLIWNAPVHIVTYYRYLRLYRDGTAISLTTTEEPADVVHHFSRENLLLHRATSSQHRGQPLHQHLPSAFMSGAYKGRWRLSSPMSNAGRDLPEVTSVVVPSSGGGGSAADAEGDLSIETEGVGKYIYRLELSLRSAGKAAGRNNKLVWRGYWHYDRFTDDWGQFQLTHDKPFFFSRVKSYGLGE